MKIIDANPTTETKRVIFKYPLHQYQVDSGLFRIPMLSPHQILSVQMQEDMPVLWVLVPDCDEDDDVVVARNVFLIMTGERWVQPTHHGISYLGTVQKANGLVGHVFIEDLPPPKDYTNLHFEVGVEGDLFNLHETNSACTAAGCKQATEELDRAVTNAREVLLASKAARL